MASISTNPISVRNPLLNFASALGNALIGMAERNRRVTEMNRLNAMSDAELEAMGLAREDIARHVFRDVYFM